MLSEEEEKFLVYWEERRELYSKASNKFLRGLPMALVFGLPILLLIAVVYIFIPDWYIKVSKTSTQTFIVVVIAVFIAIVFYAFVRMHFKWEMNEQLYNELKNVQKKEAANKQ